ncbi:hypothetical protein [Microbispora hainanensis]|uniref:Secreted protein n=1 Tax=Microbispora hainanensis TaxID=568844 RepID=A0A544YZ59_9ACTN|nr:hypothetical protein [Microbispora hainanensis]TQS21772.1 hypothetical protein FLX08_11295 [Microbispora hainanensis]
MRRGLTAALLLLLHAILLTSGGTPASPSPSPSPSPAWVSAHRPAARHVVVSPARDGARLTDTRACAPAHATRPAQGDPPRVRTGGSGSGATGGPVVLTNPAAPRGGTRVTRAGPHHDGPPAQRPRRAAAARAPPSTAY